MVIICEKCRTEILEGTDAAKDKICIPCGENRPLFDDASRNVRTFRKRLDGQLIHLIRISQSKVHADYEVTSTLWDIDPRFRSRNTKAGTVSSILRIRKDTGEITVVYPMAFDGNGKILLKAKRVLLKAFEKGELPEKTCYASG
ncbi:hypothetical protein NBRC116583_39110 [Arenicella sp. 4NH20-0111]|uniref:hypothetical protein n=1 Tax=Arenicella sp. 4NH20-0111 TaxID=3127648 RepID=UPI0031072382